MVETAARTICNCLTLIIRAMSAPINRMFKTIRLEDIIVRIEVLEDTVYRSRNWVKEDVASVEDALNR